MYRKRNEIRHFELVLSFEETVEVVGKLEECYQEAHSFFSEFIQGFDKTFAKSRYMTYSEGDIQRKHGELMNQMADAVIESKKRLLWVFRKRSAGFGILF